MKTAFKKNGENGAVVLTTTICTFSLMSFLVVGYLWMMMEQSKATDRSQHWNAALTVAEAGIDEGMAHINYTFNAFGMNVNYGVDGWTSNAAYYGPVSRSLSNDVGSSYTVFISNTMPPIVTSIATISDKMNPVPIKRAVQVTTVPAYVSLPPLTVRSNFTLNGQPTIDSEVGSIYGTVVTVGNGTVTGEILTGPQGSQPDVHHQGSDGGWTNNFYVSLPDVEPPYTFGTTPPTTANVTLAANTQYYFNGNYQPTSLTIANGSNTILYVTGNFSVSSITVQPTGSFTLYVGSTNSSTTTSATFGQTSSDRINFSGTPEQFYYFGLPNNTQIDLKNGLNIVNAIFYAPEAAFTQDGGQTVTGSIVANTYTANGSGNNFKKGPGLPASGPVLGYAVASWKEIPPP